MNFPYINESASNFIFPQTTDQKISGFLNLAQGWHYGEGNAPNDETVDDALRINNQATLLGLRTEAFPGINGEIQVSCYSGAKTLEFTIESTGRTLLVEEEDDIETSSQEGLTVGEVMNLIREKHGETAWNSFYQSTQCIIADIKGDLRVWHSRIPLTGAEYQLYPNPA